MKFLYTFREYIKSMYQKNTVLFNIILRFVMGVGVCLTCNYMIGYSDILKSIYTILIVAVLFCILPVEALILLSASLAIGHIYAASQIMAALFGTFFFILYILYLQFGAKNGYVVLLMPIVLCLRIPYFMPVILGVLFEPAIIFPMSVGIVVYFMLYTLSNVLVSASTDTINLFQIFVAELFADKRMFVVLIIFVCVTIMVCIISKLELNYSYEIAVYMGNIVIYIGILLSYYFLSIDISIIRFLVGGLISLLISLILSFFKVSLNYNAVEKLQFEDDEYYYYVRAVPKTTIANRDFNIMRFNTKLFDEDDGKGEDDN